jgi:hypothetical protein
MPLASSLIGLALNERFRVEEKVGEELLGSLYLATDEHPDHHGRKVMVKVLHPHLTGNEEKFARFAREITATDMVRHPNTVGVVGWGQHLELYYLVLEHVVAHPLADELAKGAMPPDRAAHIAAQVAAAVGAAHQEGVVHRNLSPHNVLLLENVSNGDFVKVRDFGLSKLESGDSDDGNTHLTQAGARVGNTHYMAPEYIEEGKVHPKGDLYAVGALFHHMVSGQTPYQGRAADVLTAHIADPVPQPTAVRPSLPAWCDDVVAKLMAKHPKERPGGYQVVQLLEGHVGHSLAAPELLEVRADGTVVRPSRAPAVAAGVMGMAMLAGAAALVLLGLFLVAGAGVYTVMNRPPPPPEGLEPLAPAKAAPLPPVEGGPAPRPAPGAPAETPAPAPAPAAPPSARPAPTPKPRSAPAPAPAAAPKVGRVEVTSNQRALVYVDGEARGYTPAVLSEAEGERTIRVVLPGQAASAQKRTIRFAPTTDEHLQIRFP